MQTPEEFEWSLYQSMDHQMDDWKDRDEVHALIRARDAEVAEQARAEMLADVHNIARVSTLTGTDVRLIIEAIRETNGLHWETSATLAGQPGGPFRRLVGPWEQVEP